LSHERIEGYRAYFDTKFDLNTGIYYNTMVSERYITVKQAWSLVSCLLSERALVPVILPHEIFIG